MYRVILTLDVNAPSMLAAVKQAQNLCDLADIVGLKNERGEAFLVDTTDIAGIRITEAPLPKPVKQECTCGDPTGWGKWPYQGG